MDFMNILQKTGQVAGAMNPAYQEGVQMAQRERQRKQMNILMQSPMMQKALQEVMGPNAELGSQFLQAIPPEQIDPLKMMELFTPQQEKMPKTFEAAAIQGILSPQEYAQWKALGREQRGIAELYQKYNMLRLKQNDPEAMYYMNLLKDSGINIPPGMPEMSLSEFDQYMRTGKMSQVPSSRYQGNMDLQKEINDAYEAIDSGEDEKRVKRQFKEFTGQNLPPRK